METRPIGPTNPAQASLYSAPSGRVDVVDVPTMRFAVVDGVGRPQSDAFAQAIQGLFTVAWGVRFALRGGPGEEKVSPLEALWSWNESDEGGAEWRAMIRLPRAATKHVVQAVKREALTRHAELGVALDAVSLVDWREGLSVQTMHVGPYDREEPTVRLLRDFIDVNGYVATGRHHEIYLGDPRRSAPEKLRTILRQPVRRRSGP
ncbi:MAG TPA: GyrI-like domain-containing protein [Candidatus Dormibacteraeota bacterium]|nr:GyrI-like domain-containing protein [Candidatus Dormibacteraeota bacterium]